jgi:HicB family
MDLTPYLTTLREDLTTAASAGDENTQRTAAVLAAALEPAARLAIMNALSDLAAEVTVELTDRIVEVRLDGRDVRVVVSGTASPTDDESADEATQPPMSEPSGDISRITLRLFEEVKSKAEEAAAAQGISLNSWVSQAVQGALQNRGRTKGEWRDRTSGSGTRLRGWVQG